MIVLAPKASPHATLVACLAIVQNASAGQTETLENRTAALPCRAFPDLPKSLLETSVGPKWGRRPSVWVGFVGNSRRVDAACRPLGWVMLVEGSCHAKGTAEADRGTGRDLTGRAARAALSSRLREVERGSEWGATASSRHGTARGICQISQGPSLRSWGQSDSSRPYKAVETS